MHDPTRLIERPQRARGVVSAALTSIFVLAMLPVAAPAKVGKNEWKQARVHLLDYFENRKIVAKLPLKNNGKFYVTPEGEPDGKQGKRFGVPKGDLAAAPGDEVWLAFSLGQGDRINLVAYCCKNRKRKQRGIQIIGSSFWARFFVELGREGTPEDLEPEKVARALSGFFDIEGFNPEEALADAAAALEQGPLPLPSPVAAAGRPTLLALEATTSPATLRIGQTVELHLEYEVGGPPAAPTMVRETRTLSFAGAVLPGYPASQETLREPGVHATSLPQSIPAGAATGTYEYRGEVCLGADCISRTVTLEVNAG